MMRKDLTTGCNHIKSEVDNKNHHKRRMFRFMFSAIALSLLSLSISALAVDVNAQPYSSVGSVSGATNSTSSTSGVTEMGICQVGAGGPCNGR